MEHRINKFFSRKTYAADYTEVIDINIRDVISGLVFQVEGLNATAGMIAPLTRAITKIELVDGSEVLWGLDGEELEALDWYDNNGRFRANYNYQMNGGTCKRFIGINFGRFLYDPIYAFDPKKFNNPQLRVSIDSGVAANTCATLYLTIRACIFDTDPVGLIGFLKANELKQWTMEAGVHEYTTLPIDEVIRGLYLRAYLAGTESNQCVSNLKLSEDQDKRIPFDDDPFILYSTILNGLPKVKETFFGATDAANRYFYISATTGVTGVSTCWNEAPLGYSTSIYDGDGGRLKTKCSTVGENEQFHIEGYVPHAVFKLPFGDPQNPADWYDPRGLGSLIADITGGAGAQGYLFLQTVRNY